MNDITRRKLLRNLAMTAVLGNVACEQKDCAKTIATELGAYILYTFFFGIASSETLTDFREWDEILRDRLLEEPLFTPTYTFPPGPTLGGVGIAAAGGASAAASSPQIARAGGAPAPRTVEGRPPAALYVADTLGNSQVDGQIHAIEINGRTVTVRGSVGLRPAAPSAPFINLRHLALSADGHLLIVSQEGTPSQWILIDTASLDILGRVMAPPNQFARRAVISPDGKLAFVVAATSQSTSTPPVVLHVIDTTARSIIGAIPLPENTPIADLTITPDQGLLFGVNRRLIHVMDVRSGTYSGAIDVLRLPSDPLGPMAGRFSNVVMNPTGAKFYASPLEFAAESRYAIGVFDVGSVEKIGEITVRNPPNTGSPLLALSPSGETILYSTQLGTEVQAFNVETGAEVATIPVDPAFRLTGLVIV